MLWPSCRGEVAPEPAAPDHAPAHFTVRGRWPGPPRLSYWIEADAAPLAANVCREAIAAALAVWSRTGVVDFRPAASRAAADVVYGFRRGHHGACEPFGQSSAIAHAGPVQPGTFVHFDQDRSWSARGGTGHSLFRTALHETGHVLGLGHSADPTAVMTSGAVPQDALAVADLAGLFSLYGGGHALPGDLHVRDGTGRTTAILRGAAPPDRTDYAVFDTDGDGRAEVLVWRTDAQGHGALMVYHFAPGAVLARTAGPFYGLSAASARTAVLRTEAGERLLVTQFAQRTSVRRFDDQGLPAPHEPAALPAARIAQAVAAAPVREGDLDGDGRPERVER